MSSITFPTKKCGMPLKEALQRFPELKKFESKKNQIDLGNTEALLLYNRLILQDFLSLDFTIPFGFLVPTICSRWSFVEWMLQDRPTTILEIGTGASAIIALMMAQIGCTVEATEINETAFQSAQKNIKLNELESNITLLKTITGIISENFDSINKFDAIICNPPQYDQNFLSSSQSSTLRGFGGQKLELVGGEKGDEFIKLLLEEVASYDSTLCVYFQLTLPSLVPIIESYLLDKGFEFKTETKAIGTRKRSYFRVNFLKTTS
ncbi:MAG: RlmF-related methyltransferase [Candidatus Hodarchaeales archaeon]|jgi:methylase of polypeptide subunit release factors